jgi:two-component system sensor histidine kinase GlrK
MRVSTKIVSGFGILMVLAVVALAYQVSVIHEMQSINRDLSGVNFRAASTVLEMLHILETVEEFSTKYFLLGYPVYEQTLTDVRQEFMEDFQQLQTTVRTDQEREELDRLSEAWNHYWTVFEDQKQKRRVPESADTLPAALASALNRLQAQTYQVYDVVQLSIRQQVTDAADAGAAAERFSWTTGALAFVLGIGVIVVSVGAINTPLRQLTSGTRMIAKGKFWHRLPSDGTDEFSELARDFNAMTQRLGELDQMKKDFVSHVSHELKAPLASIRQMVHVMMQEIPGPLNEQQKKLLRLSYSSADRLAAMVGNLLDVSRMDAGTMEYEITPHDLSAVLESVAHEFELQARQKNISFRLEFDDGGVFVECDRDRIIQVIGNLFENALKFSPEGGEIVSRIQRVTRSGEARVMVSVSDSGPGVPDAHKHKVFLKFHQIKQGKKLTGQGVGLGLHICKMIVEAHSGEIWVEDNPAGGSVFCFTLNSTMNSTIQAEAAKCV